MAVRTVWEWATEDARAIFLERRSMGQRLKPAASMQQGALDTSMLKHKHQVGHSKGGSAMRRFCHVQDRGGRWLQLLDPTSRSEDARQMRDVLDGLHWSWVTRPPEVEC